MFSWCFCKLERLPNSDLYRNTTACVWEAQQEPVFKQLLAIHCQMEEYIEWDFTEILAMAHPSKTRLKDYRVWVNSADDRILVRKDECEVTLLDRSNLLLKQAIVSDCSSIRNCNSFLFMSRWMCLDTGTLLRRKAVATLECWSVIDETCEVTTLFK